MAQYKDYLPSQNAWIHDLAKAENDPNADKTLGSINAQQLVEESTVDFLTELNQRFAEFANLFNAYSENGARFPEVRIYSVAQTASDFILFRNQVRLLVRNSSHGAIQITFAEHSRGAISVDGQIKEIQEG